jgi:hypothetical protein
VTALFYLKCEIVSFTIAMQLSPVGLQWFHDFKFENTTENKSAALKKETVCFSETLLSTYNSWSAFYGSDKREEAVHTSKGSCPCSFKPISIQIPNYKMI